ncbi:MAG TPA: hypothetical protein PKB07_25850, partial [Flavilitoribacter sp.]|nr:hypothetical protein [Flavilitoribacter sp.]
MKKSMVSLVVLVFCASTFLFGQLPTDSLKTAKETPVSELKTQVGAVQPTDSLRLADSLGTDSLRAEVAVVRRERVSEIKMGPINGKTGTVVLNVCINAAGEVTTASFTQRGSTTFDRELINAATEDVK